MVFFGRAVDFILPVDTPNKDTVSSQAKLVLNCNNVANHGNKPMTSGFFMLIVR